MSHVIYLSYKQGQGEVYVALKEGMVMVLVRIGVGLLKFRCDGCKVATLLSYEGERWADFYARAKKLGWYYFRIDPTKQGIKCYCAQCNKKRQRIHLMKEINEEMQTIKRLDEFDAKL